MAESTYQKIKRYRENINSVIEKNYREFSKSAEIIEKRERDIKLFDEIGPNDKIIQFFKNNNYNIRQHYKNEHGEVLIVESDYTDLVKAVVLYKGTEQEKFYIIGKNKYISRDFYADVKDNVLSIKNVKIMSKITPVSGMEKVCVFEEPRELGRNLSRQFGIEVN